jgi:hypothetical protein
MKHSFAVFLLHDLIADSGWQSALLVSLLPFYNIMTWTLSSPTHPNNKNAPKSTINYHISKFMENSPQNTGRQFISAVWPAHLLGRMHKDFTIGLD